MTKLFKKEKKSRKPPGNNGLFERKPNAENRSRNGVYFMNRNDSKKKWEKYKDRTRGKRTVVENINYCKNMKSQFSRVLEYVNRQCPCKNFNLKRRSPLLNIVYKNVLHDYRGISFEYSTYVMRRRQVDARIKLNHNYAFSKIS